MSASERVLFEQRQLSMRDESAAALQAERRLRWAIDAAADAYDAVERQIRNRPVAAPPQIISPAPPLPEASRANPPVAPSPATPASFRHNSSQLQQRMDALRRSRGATPAESGSRGATPAESELPHDGMLPTMPRVHRSAVLSRELAECYATMRELRAENQALKAQLNDQRESLREDSWVHAELEEARRARSEMEQARAAERRAFDDMRFSLREAEAESERLRTLLAGTVWFENKL